MGAIHRIVIEVKTATGRDAGTKGRVFLGVCGREFRLRRTANDYRSGAETIFVLGEGATVSHPALNDPRHPQLDTDWAEKYPAYIRFEPLAAADRWKVRVVCVRVEGDLSLHDPSLIKEFGTRSSSASEGMWLGRDAGLFYFLNAGICGPNGT